MKNWCINKLTENFIYIIRRTLWGSLSKKKAGCSSTLSPFTVETVVSCCRRKKKPELRKCLPPSRTISRSQSQQHRTRHLRVCSILLVTIWRIFAKPLRANSESSKNSSDTRYHCCKADFSLAFAVDPVSTVHAQVEWDLRNTADYWRAFMSCEHFVLSFKEAGSSSNLQKPANLCTQLSVKSALFHVISDQ